MVHHSDDLTALVVDNAFLLLVVKSRHGEATFVVLVVLEVVKRIRCSVLSRDVLIRRCKSPTLLKHLPVDRGIGNDVLETLEFTDDQSTVGPRTCVGHIEVISAFLGRELGTRLVLDEVTEDRLLSLELARLVLGIDPVENVLLLVLSLLVYQHAVGSEAINMKTDGHCARV